MARRATRTGSTGLRWIRYLEGPDAKTRLYAHRVTRGYSYHRYPRGDPLSGLCPGPGAGTQNHLRVQPQADRRWPADVRAGLRRALAFRRLVDLQEGHHAVHEE